MSAYLNPSFSDEQIRQLAPVVMERASGFDPASTRLQLLRLQEAAVAHERTKDPNLTLEELNRVATSQRILPFAYRPFDTRWIYYEELTKLLDRPRPDYLKAGTGREWSILSSQSNRRQYDPPCISRNIASLHVIERGTNAFPTELYNETREGVLYKPHVQQNVSIEAVHYLSSRGHSSEQLFFHALATMHTPQYRTDNSGALLNDWPRIPLPASAELLTTSADLGRRLADLLDPESTVELAADWRTLGRLILPPEAPEGKANRDQVNADRYALTAGWGGPGQGGTVMPRRGKCVERDYTAHEHERIATLAAQNNLSVDEALALLGERCVDVYLNGDSYWTCVPQNVWDYTLGGYQVLKKWLSYRELPLLGRPLREDEATWFSEVVRRIAAILLLGPELDASYAAILPNATGLPKTATT